MESLGIKHREFNKLVDESLQNKPLKELEDLDYDAPDLDNLFKIEYACRTRNVGFILKVLKCNDMLYVTRALKHSIWMVQDPQYVHIINPQYLDVHLFPYMMTKARAKFLLNIRLNLKDRIRSEEFFVYLINLNSKLAMKWFPNCTSEFIVSNLNQDTYRLSEESYERLFAVDIETLNIYIKTKYWKRKMLEKTLYMIGKHGEKYFDILDSVTIDQIPTLNSKYTKLVMQMCPHRLINNLDRYANAIDVPTLLKYVNKDDLKQVIMNEVIEKVYHEVQHPPDIDDVIKMIDSLKNCDGNDFNMLHELLLMFHENYLNNDGNKKLKLKFLNILINKFYTHKFEEMTWKVLNDIFDKLGVYTVKKKNYQPFIKCIIAYDVINNKNISENVTSKFTYDTYKNEIIKFNDVEKELIFQFLFNYVSKLEPDKYDNDPERYWTWVEQILVLFKVWKKDVSLYPEISKKLDSIIARFRENSDIEGIKKLYDRNKIWRKYLANDILLLNPNEEAFINALKHYPNTLWCHKDKIDLLCLDDKDNLKKFLLKVRIYWPDSLGTYCKNVYIQHLPMTRSMGIYTLLSKSEILKCALKYQPFGVVNPLANLNEIQLRKHIAKNIYRARPTPTMDEVLPFATEIYLHDAVSSINSVLHSVLWHQSVKYINQFKDWPMFVQNLCVYIVFSKFSTQERQTLLKDIWHNTKHCSVRANIFKLTFKSFRKYKKEDVYHNSAFKDIIEAEWTVLKFLIQKLSDNECTVVYSLLCNVTLIPFSVRGDYCTIAYKYLISLPRKTNYMKYVHKLIKRIDYATVFPKLDVDVVKDVVKVAIIDTLCSQKLTWHVASMVAKILYNDKDDAIQIANTNEILLPILEKAYSMWNIMVLGFNMVKHNIYKIFHQIRSTYKCGTNIEPPINMLNIIILSLEGNVSHEDNYTLIKEFKLVTEYLKILKADIEYEQGRSNSNQILDSTDNEPEGNASDCEDDEYPSRDIFDELYRDTNDNKNPKENFQNNMLLFTEICLSHLIEDVELYGSSIWVHFCSALDELVHWFPTRLKMKLGICEALLDTTKTLAIDELVNLVVWDLLEKDIYGWSKSQTTSKLALMERVKKHPSNVVKFYCK